METTLSHHLCFPSSPCLWKDCPWAGVLLAACTNKVWDNFPEQFQWSYSSLSIPSLLCQHEQDTLFACLVCAEDEIKTLLITFSVTKISRTTVSPVAQLSGPSQQALAQAGSCCSEGFIPQMRQSHTLCVPGGVRFGIFSLSSMGATVS